jgi:hypothetical protein
MSRVAAALAVSVMANGAASASRAIQIGFEILGFTISHTRRIGHAPGFVH